MKRTLTTLLVLLLLFSLILIAPPVAALTWTQFYSDTTFPSTEIQPNGASATLPDGTLLFGFISSADNNLYIERCAPGQSCERRTLIDDAGADDDFEYDMAAVGDDEAVVCSYSERSDQIAYYHTIDGGVTWALQQIGTSSAFRKCGIDKVGDTVWVATCDSGNNLDVDKSVDNGASWVNTVLGLDLCTDHVEVAAKNSTDLLLTYMNFTTSALKRCYSTTGGDAWTCPTVSLAGSLTHNELQWSSVTNRFQGLYTTATSVTRYQFAGVSSGVSTNVISSTEAAVDAGALYVHDATIWLASWIDGEGGSEDLRVAFTQDAGESWTVEDTAMPDIGGFESSNAAVSLIGGVVYAGYTYSTLAAMTANVYSATLIEPEAPLGHTATTPVTDLVGFDVDPTGGIAIARTELGENVRIYNAQTLTATSSALDTDCAAGTNDYEDAVMAKALNSGNSAQLVAFLDCTASGDAETLTIKTSDGEDPTSNDFSDTIDGEDCTAGTQCPMAIGLSDFEDNNAGADSALGQLGQIRDFPIDYSTNEEVVFVDNRQVAWAYASQQCAQPPGPDYCASTEPGFVGVASFTARAAGDTANTDAVQHHPTQDVHDFCLGKDGATYYLASAVTGQQSHTWEVLFDTSSGQDGTDLDASIAAGASSFGSSGAAVACGGGQILHFDGSSTTIELRTRTGAFLDSVAVASGFERNVAISEEFILGDEDALTCTTASEGTGNCVQYGVYADGTTATILNLTGGNIVELGEITLPGGTFHSIRMDRSGQSVWVATTTTISRFSVFALTTVDPIGTPAPPDVEAPSTGLFAGKGATVGTALGTGEFGGNLFLGTIVMGLTAYGVGTGYGNTEGQRSGTRALRVNPWAAAIGAAMGFLLAWGFGFFSTAVVFSMVVLVAIIIGIKMVVSRG